MKLFVKAAHTFIHGYHSIDIIRANIIRHSPNLTIHPTFAIRALLPLMDPDIIRRPVDLTASHPLPTPSLHSLMAQRRALDRFADRDRTILFYCLHSGAERKTIRRSITLNVDHLLTVGELKSVLSAQPWIPKKDLLLVQGEERGLEDNDCTLDECGVNDGDTLLACMGGSFTVVVSCERLRLELVVPVGSCFETIGDVRRKIYEMMGCPTESHGQELYKDSTRLVALGIVRPYLTEINNYLDMSSCLDIRMPIFV